MSSTSRRRFVRSKTNTERLRFKGWISVLLCNAGFQFRTEGELDAIVREQWMEPVWRAVARYASPNNPRLVALAKAAVKQ